MIDDPSERLRRLPALGRLLDLPESEAARQEYGREALATTLRTLLDEARQAILADAAPGALTPTTLLEAAEKALQATAAPRLRPVINATGIIVHTNLGRAPLAPAALAALARVAGGYSNLEFDLDAGARGSRHDIVADLLRLLTGAEAALAVNNNAAAVMLALAAVAAGGEVIVSRGELVEIGGSFRIPDIIAQSGARLIEVGTTNKTRLGDYEAAIGPQTRALLKVHQSNFRIAGFTASVSLEELAPLAHARGVLLVEDLGSGSLLDLAACGGGSEPTVRQALAAGPDLLTMSGDKLLGGPQAGLVLGTKEMIARLRRHPLLRAVRIDKLGLAALEATLRLYLDPERARREIPVLRMLTEPIEHVARRAERLAGLLAAGLGTLATPPLIEIAQEAAYAGGGALPDEAVPSRQVSLRSERPSVAALAQALRRQRPAVVARLSHGRLLLDARTLTNSELEAVVAAVRAGCGAA